MHYNRQLCIDFLLFVIAFDMQMSNDNKYKILCRFQAIRQDIKASKMADTQSIDMVTLAVYICTYRALRY